MSFPIHFLFKWRQNLSARPRTSRLESLSTQLWEYQIP